MMIAKSGRLLVAVALAATFFLALPAQAMDEQGGPSGFFEQLAVWAAQGWEGLFGITLADAKPTSVDHDGGFVDPNGGGGGRTGSACPDPSGDGCNNASPTNLAVRSGS